MDVCIECNLNYDLYTSTSTVQEGRRECRGKRLWLKKGKIKGKMRSKLKSRVEGERRKGRRGKVKGIQ